MDLIDVILGAKLGGGGGGSGGSTDAGHVSYSSSQTYSNGTVGKAISDINGVLPETFIVTFDATTANSQNNTIQADKTFAEIVEAYTNNKNIIFQYGTGTGTYFMGFSSSDYSIMRNPSLDTCIVSVPLEVVPSASLITVAIFTYLQEYEAWELGTVVLHGDYTAGDIGYDSTQTYSANTVGKAISDANQALSLKENALTIVTKLATDEAQTLAADTFYIFPEMEELAITCPVTGLYGFRFTSGTTPTVFTIAGPTQNDTIVMPDDWEGAEASTTYEMSILNGYCLVSKWEVSGS